MKKSEAHRLADLVALVCKEKKRPVCSRDLALWIKDNPDSPLVPYLRQRIGQCLLKLSQRVKPLIFSVGMLVDGNRMYYSTSQAPEERVAFESYRNQVQAEAVADWKMSEHVKNLIGTPYESEARNAAAGFCLVYRELAQGFEKLKKEIAVLEGLKADSYLPIKHEELVDSKRAKEMIYSKAKEFLGEVEGERIQMKKIMSLLRISRFIVLANRAVKGLYSKKQIDVFCRIRWGVGVDDPDLLKSLLVVLKF